LRKWEDDPLNREKLQKAINESSQYKNGGMTEQEQIISDKKRKCSAYDSAKAKYESGEVSKYDIYFGFSTCYDLVKNDLQDNSILISQEKGRKIWDRVKQIFADYDFENDAEEVFTTTNKAVVGIYKLVPREVLLRQIFRSVLFHIWAVKHFKTPKKQRKL
jgi:hypothetical protein